LGAAIQAVRLGTGCVPISPPCLFAFTARGASEAGSPSRQCRWPKPAGARCKRGWFPVRGVPSVLDSSGPRSLETCAFQIGGRTKCVVKILKILESFFLTFFGHRAYRSTEVNDASSGAASQRPRVVFRARSGHAPGVNSTVPLESPRTSVHVVRGLGHMIRPIGPLRFAWAYAQRMRMPRSGPIAGALSLQLSALDRRRQLRQQQEDLQAGLADYEALPPYPLRPRPPS